MRRKYSRRSNSGRRFRLRAEILERRELLTFGFGSVFGAGSSDPFGNDHVQAIATDAAGDYYVGGTYSGSVNLDPAGSSAGVLPTNDNAFLAKYRSDGTFGWVRAIGAFEGEAHVNAISVDSVTGNLYIAGTIAPTIHKTVDSNGHAVWTYTNLPYDFDGVQLTPTDNPAQVSSNPDVFVAKVIQGTDPTTGAPTASFAWAQRMGGTDLDAASGLAYYTSGGREYLYVGGGFGASPTVGPDGNSPSAMSLGVSSFGGTNGYAWKLDITGANSSALPGTAWFKTQSHLSSDARANGLAIDATGNVYLVGSFTGTVDFDPADAAGSDSAAVLTSFVGRGQIPSQDVYFWKLNAAGGFAWVGQLGGVQVDSGNAIAVQGNYVYVAGSFDANSVLGGHTNDFDPGKGKASLATYSSGGSLFVGKYDLNRNYIWARSIGGQNGMAATSVAVDSAGNVYTTGTYSGTTDFDPSSGTYNLNSGVAGAVFVSKLTSAGLFASAASSGALDSTSSYYPTSSSALAVDGSQNVYVGGTYEGRMDFDPTDTGHSNQQAILTSTRDSSNNYTGDLFILKLTQAGVASPTGASPALAEPGQPLLSSSTGQDLLAAALADPDLIFPSPSVLKDRRLFL